MTYKASIVGIDGSGKSACSYLILKNLSQNFNTGIMSRIGYVSHNQNIKKLFSRSSIFLDTIQGITDSLETRIGIAMINSIDATFFWPFKEIIMKKYNLDILLYPRDKILDPAVYMTYYLPLTKKINHENRLKISKLLNPNHHPDILFYLDLPVELAYEIILKRINDDEKSKKLDRPKLKPHMHENIKDMKILQNYFLESIEFLKKEGMKICNIDATRDKDLVSEDISNVIRKELKNISN